ncbi:hypothetical protein EJB05_33189, partial [Eragrostis curvula]
MSIKQSFLQASVIFDQRAQLLIGRPVHVLEEKYDRSDIPPEISCVKTNFKPLIPIRSNEIPKDDTPKSCIQDDTELDPMDIENPEQVYHNSIRANKE